MPTRGMERWLTQRMSWGLGASTNRADGVCANVDFPTPHQLVSAAVAAASGIDPGADPWLPERAVWPLLAIVDGGLDEPWLRTLAEHLKGPIKHGRRFASLRHLAGLYDRYALHRPEMVRAWAAGEDGGVSDDAAWQAELWRRLRARIGSASPAERIEAACARLRSEPGIVELPERLWAVQPDAAPGRPPRRAPSARRGTGRPPLRPAPVTGAMGSARGRVAGHHAQGGPDRREQRPARVVGARLKRASARAQAGRARRPPAPRRAPWRDAARPHPGRRPRGPARDRGAARRQRPGPLVPRPRAPGRGPARHDPAPARRRPDARAARRDRDVPRHRDVRAAAAGHLRGGRGRRGGRDAAARPPGRPLAAPDESDPGRRRAAARAGRRAADRVAGARPRGP